MTDATPTCGSLDRGVHRLPVRIYYEDTDFSGVVYHASYLRFFERGRTELLRALGVCQGALQKAGALQNTDALQNKAAQPLSFVVRRMSIEFLRPAAMDDVIHVETAVVALRAASIELTQTILHEGATLAACRVLIAAVTNGRPRRIPNDVKAGFQRLIDVEGQRKHVGA